MKRGSFYDRKSVLVTGACGSIGSELVRRLIASGCKVVRAFDVNETGLFDLEAEVASEKLRPLVGDVRDRDRLLRAFEGIDVVFHAAALKHVPLCEYNPFDAVKTNVTGTQNVLDAALDQEVSKVMFVSTDKAVSPNNVLGATKLLAERLTIAATYYKGLKRKCAFSCVRFGNVLDSRGSVVPVFRKQIAAGGPVTITDTKMTRFVMSMPEAVGLITRAAERAKGGEVFVLKMPALRIADLAKVMIEELAPRYGRRPEDVRTKLIGKRPGEKLYEELMTEEEAAAAEEDGDLYVLRKDAAGSKVRANEYVSSRTRLLKREEIRALLRQTGIV